jgi:hypothetical protein
MAGAAGAAGVTGVAQIAVAVHDICDHEGNLLALTSEVSSER